MSNADYLRAIGLTLMLIIAGFVFTGCGGSVDTSSNDYPSDSSAQSDTAEPNTDDSGGEQTEYETEETGGGRYEEGSTQSTSSTPSAGGETVLEELPQASASATTASATAASATAASATLSGPEGKPLDDFLYTVAEDLDSKWGQLFADAEYSYSSPEFVIFQEDKLHVGQMANCADVIHNYEGPQYCWENETIYYPFPWTVPTTGLQLEEYGDFAVASTLAHEFAHHVQQELGLIKNVTASSIQLELQADCLTGVWANTTYYEGRLELGDIDEAVGLMATMGDTPGTPSYDPNAHGTFQQRIEAFNLGYQTGDPSQCAF